MKISAVLLLCAVVVSVAYAASVANSETKDGKVVKKTSTVSSIKSSSYRKSSKTTTTKTYPGGATRPVTTFVSRLRPSVTSAAATAQAAASAAVASLQSVNGKPSG